MSVPHANQHRRHPCRPSPARLARSEATWCRDELCARRGGQGADLLPVAVWLLQAGCPPDLAARRFETFRHDLIATEMASAARARRRNGAEPTMAGRAGERARRLRSLCPRRP
jgi:hypothetical protein